MWGHPTSYKEPMKNGDNIEIVGGGSERFMTVKTFSGGVIDCDATNTVIKDVKFHSCCQDFWNAETFIV